MEDNKLFAEFPPVSTEKWEEVINKDLKGADYEKKLVWKTIEGFKVKPYYRAEDLEHIEYLNSNPNQFPFTRGKQADSNTWDIRQDIQEKDPVKANTFALDALRRGATAIGFCAKNISTEDEMAALVKDIHLPAITIHFNCAKKYIDILKLFVAVAKRNGFDTKELKGSAEAREFLALLPHRFLEENGLHAALLNSMREYATVVEEVERFLPYVDNWATCDSLSPKVFARHTAELLPLVRRWMASRHEYTCRFGIGMLMRHFLAPDTFRPDFPQWVAAIGRDEFYVKMMQAWYFATALAKQWDAAEPFMHEGRLPEWVRRKSIQKALESFRVSDLHKSHLRTLR